MPKRRERGLCSELNRHGNRVWYFRDGHGPRLRIRGEYGSPEFNRAVHAAKGYGVAGAPAKTVLTHNDAGSLAWVIDQWMSSSEWDASKPATQKGRRNILKRVATENGAYAARDLDKQWVEEVRDAVAKSGAKSMANEVVKVLKALFKWATPRHMPVNIALGVELLGVTNKHGFHAWTDADRAKYEATHALGTSGRVFYEVLRGTGARLGDAVKLGGANLEDDIIAFVPEKTDRKTGIIVANPMEPELARALAAGPVGKETWIAGEKGQKLKKGYAGLWFRKLCDEAGLPHCTAHGVRKGEAGADAKSGCTVDELKARYGWTENRTPGIYTAQAERKALALNAAQKRLAKGKPKLALVA